MGAMMQAAVYHGPGDVRIEHVPRPADPGPGDLLVRVLRAAICGTDAGEYTDGPKLVPLDAPHPHSGHGGPLVLGHEFSGEIVAVGPEVTAFELGDRVVSGAGVSCGRCPRCKEHRTNLCERYFTIGLHIDGGLAEYVSTPARICVRVPAACSEDAAALSQPLAIALHALRRGRVAPDDRLGVIGAGGVGALVVAAAHAKGVGTVVAVDLDQGRLDAALALGATHTVRAGAGDEREQLAGSTGASELDVIVEASGAAASPGMALSLLRPGGRLVIVGLQSRPSQVDLFGLAMGEIEMLGALAHVCAEDLPEALDLLTNTDLATPSIDRVIPLEDLVADGLVPLAEGRLRGKVIVDPRPA